MPKPSFWSVARRPKWIAGLATALLVAVAFSLLMQWQLSRTFNTVGIDISQSQPVPLESLVSPNTQITEAVFDRLVTVSAELDPSQSYVVANRLQLDGEQTVPGYWLISNSWVGEVSLTLAIGFSENLDEVVSAKSQLKPQKIDLVGYLEPAEAPKESVAGVIGSVSLAQLVNLYSAEPLASFPAYVIVQSGLDTPLDPITIGIRQQTVEVNWLTAFYAIEWAFFALAAFYLWWRMVADQVARERESDN